MDKHSFNIFPEMKPENYQRLLDDLKQNGYDNKYPIYTYQGKIIDGWNRYKACQELNITPVFEEFKGNDIEVLNFIMRSNKRRDLTSSQWATIAIDADDIVMAIQEESERIRREKISEARQGVNQFEGSRPGNLFPGLPDNTPEDVITETFSPEEESASDTYETRTSSKLADTFNTNSTYVKKAKKLKEQDPEAYEQVKSGEKTITEVEKERKKRERQDAIKKQKEEIESGALQSLDGLFDVIVLDPPWNYGREYDPDGSRVANPYPELTQDELMMLDIPVKDDCVLWLWTTHQFIWDAKELLDKWGFTYKATLVWNKEKLGMGAWLRMQCEFCLLGIKGKPYFNNTSYRDIIIEPRREHSRKPEGFYTMVNEICAGRKLEYFAREKRDGWEVFGNDVSKFNGELAG